jgi:hypothetical protein
MNFEIVEAVRMEKISFIKSLGKQATENYYSAAR